MKWWYDPIVLFTAFCLAVPCVMPYAPAPLTGPSGMCSTYLVDPVFLVSLSLVPLTYLWAGTGGKTYKLSDHDNHLIRWYLCNGAIFHTMMDFWTAVGYPEEYHHYYGVLDKRFIVHESTVIGIGSMEFFLYSPLCYLTVRAIRQRRPERYFLELIIAVAHIYGAIMFVGTELYNGGHNVPTDWDLSFDVFEMFYFWFGMLICNGIWVAYPLVQIKRIYKALMDREKAFRKVKKH